MRPEVIQFRAESGLAAAMSEVGRREQITMAEWARRRLRQALEADGIQPPPLSVRRVAGSLNSRQT